MIWVQTHDILIVLLNHNEATNLCDLELLNTYLLKTKSFLLEAQNITLNTLNE